MSYLKDFLKHIANHDCSSFLTIWEEYCSGDELDTEEAIKVLKAVKNASFCEEFGKHVQNLLPLWETVKDPRASHELFALIIDLDTTQDPGMGDRVQAYLQQRYPNDKLFAEKMRMIGFKNKNQYQGSVSNFALLSHIDKNKFVFHSGGWGVGIVLEYSLVREQVSLEFDYVAGKKDLSFQTALKTLIPLPDDHFLAQRFGDPDQFEEKSKKDPAEAVYILLRDLGPKTAGEIKDELCELVIPASEWTKWWQTARAKIKKDTRFEVPNDLRSPFYVREAKVSHETILQQALENKPDAGTLVHMVYSFIKDFPETLKNASFKSELTTKIQEVLSYPEISPAQRLQIYFLLQDMGVDQQEGSILEILQQNASGAAVSGLLQGIAILAYKKRALVEVKRSLPQWTELFLSIFLTVEQNTLRDYVLSELLAKEEAQVVHKLETLLAHPEEHPETFVWFFQKILSQKKLPFSDKTGVLRFFEGFLILLSCIELKPEYKELTKKIHSILSADRYAIVRQFMADAGLEEVKEFLLLSTKCHSLSDHDIKIFHSLAEVAHPSLIKGKKKSKEDLDEEPRVIWTTEQGYTKLKQRIQQIATVETVENAKEIEVARAHGDLRENAEFKAALEKRDRLQSELKTLSDQLNQARILSSQDIAKDIVGVGAVVHCKNNAGDNVTYTLLGPWDADPTNHILSFQSKLAQTMQGLVVGNSFTFQGETFTILSIESFL
ncbi:MAG: transcript cleavage factor [Chlamydiae bacterium]|nr:transcript cleavage factor [Chlamydiota bacterium]